MSKGLGDRIKRLRKERGWSQADLAGYATINQTQISRLEKGDAREPTAPTLVSIARALGTTVEYLWKGRDVRAIRYAAEGGLASPGIKLGTKRPVPVEGADIVPLYGSVDVLDPRSRDKEELLVGYLIMPQNAISPDTGLAFVNSSADLVPAINPGDILAVDTAIGAIDELIGKYVLVDVNGRILLRVLRKTPESYYLEALNEDTTLLEGPLLLTIDTMHIVARVVGFWRSL